jgi:hypothetical protein
LTAQIIGQAHFFQDIPMTHRIDDVHINRAHSDAICQEIGDRLRISLTGTGEDPSPALRSLMEQLAKTEAAGRA